MPLRCRYRTCLSRVNAGFKELVSFDKLGVEYPYTSVVVLRQTAAKSPDLVERFIKCIVEGIHIFKTDKAKSLAALRLYMKGADEAILEESYQHTRSTMTRRLTHPYKLLTADWRCYPCSIRRQNKPMRV